MLPKKIALEVAKIARKKKAKKITLLDVKRQTSYCNYLIIATVESLPQMNALENTIVSYLKQKGIRQYTSQRLPENPPSPSWRVLDFGATVVHIMTPEARSFYTLEKIFHKAKRIKI